jgi:glycosyltransferase involved in cell wall biosynthesis
MDGGSTDGSVEILQRCAAEFEAPDYSLLWVSERDRGFADALGKGFSKAKGEIVGWLNSDDTYFDRFAVETAVRTLAVHPGDDVVFGDVALISESGGLWMIWCFPEFKYERALRGYIVPQPTLFVRRKVIEQHSIASLVGVGLDHAWYLEIGRDYKFRHVGRVQATDRDHGGRRTHTLPAWQEEIEQLRAKYGTGYVPSSFDKFSDKATRLLMRLKGLASWTWVFLNSRVARNLAFPAWVDSPWKVFSRQCTMRLRKRSELGDRPAQIRWPGGTHIWDGRQTEDRGSREVMGMHKKSHEPSKDTASSTPTL